MQKILPKVKQAGSEMVLTMPFFAYLKCKMLIVEDETIPTFCTNGKVIKYNPQYATSLTLAQVICVIAEEVMHVAHLHPYRRPKWCNPREWNIDCDMALSGLLKKAGFDIADMLYDPQYEGMSAEKIAMLRRQNGENVEEQEICVIGVGPGKPGDKNQGGCGIRSRGEVEDNTDPDAEAQADEWKVAIINAANAAKAAGKLPGGLEYLINSIEHPKIDWKSFMHKFIQTCAREDYSWIKPDPRYAGQGVYSPVLESENMPPVVFFWDTSGSRDYDKARTECATEAAAIIQQVRPEAFYVGYFDTQVHWEKFEPGDPINFHPKGGGGTDFRILGPAIKELDIEPACVVVLTDGIGPFGEYDGEVPWLWAMTTDVIPPYGEHIRLEVD